MNNKTELALRIIACLLALFLFVLLVFSWIRREIDVEGVGARQMPPKELVGIAYFQKSKQAPQETLVCEN